MALQMARARRGLCAAVSLWEFPVSLKIKLQVRSEKVVQFEIRRKPLRTKTHRLVVRGRAFNARKARKTMFELDCSDLERAIKPEVWN